MRLIAIAALVVCACGATAPPEAAEFPTPSATRAPAPTGAPSATSTSTPRAPTRQPADTPRATPRTVLRGQTAARELVSQIAAALERVTSASAAMRSRIEAGDLPGLRAVVNSMLTLVERERRWLLDHPPVECLTELHGAWSSALVFYNGGLQLMQAGLADGTSVDTLDAALQSLSLSEVEMGRAERLMDGVCGT